MAAKDLKLKPLSTLRHEKIGHWFKHEGVVYVVCGFINSVRLDGVWHHDFIEYHTVDNPKVRYARKADDFFKNFNTTI